MLKWYCLTAHFRSKQLQLETRLLHVDSLKCGSARSECASTRHIWIYEKGSYGAHRWATRDILPGTKRRIHAAVYLTAFIQVATVLQHWMSVQHRRVKNGAHHPPSVATHLSHASRSPHLQHFHAVLTEHKTTPRTAVQFSSYIYAVLL